MSDQPKAGAAERDPRVWPEAEDVVGSHGWYRTVSKVSRDGDWRIDYIGHQNPDGSGEAVSAHCDLESWRQSSSHQEVAAVAPGEKG